MAKRNSDKERDANNIKMAQDFIERNKTKTSDELKRLTKNTHMSNSEKRQMQDYLEKDSSRELNKNATFGDVDDSGKLLHAIYDDTPSAHKTKRKDVLALSSTKYTNKLLEKMLESQNNTAVTENTLKFQQQVTASLAIISDDIKLISESVKPKEAPQTQAERKELEVEASALAKSVSKLDINGALKVFGEGVLKQFDTDGTGELLMTMLGSMKEQVQEGSFGATIKGMIQDAIMKRIPHGAEIGEWKDDPVGFTQRVINSLGMSENAGIRSLFKAHIKGMKPSIKPTVEKVDLSAAAVFDNKAHISLTRIIPDQLYRIVSLLSGEEERRFDWSEQQYRNLTNILFSEFNRNASNTVTSQIDSQMNEMVYNVKDIAAVNPTVNSMLVKDENGKIKENRNGIPVFKNGPAVRKVLTAVLKSGATLEDIASGDPIQVIKQWKLNKDFKESEYSDCLDAVIFLKEYYSSLPDIDRVDAFASMKDAKRQVNNPIISEVFQTLSSSRKKLYQSIYSSTNLSKDDMESVLKRLGGQGIKVDFGKMNGTFDMDKTSTAEGLSNIAKILSDAKFDIKNAVLNVEKLEGNISAGETVSDKKDDKKQEPRRSNSDEINLSECIQDIDPAIFKMKAPPTSMPRLDPRLVTRPNLTGPTGVFGIRGGTSRGNAAIRDAIQRARILLNNIDENNANKTKANNNNLNADTQVGTSGGTTVIQNNVNSGNSHFTDFSTNSNSNETIIRNSNTSNNTSHNNNSNLNDTLNNNRYSNINNQASFTGRYYNDGNRNDPESILRDLKSMVENSNVTPEERDKFIKFISDITSGDDIEKIVYSEDLHDSNFNLKTNDAKYQFDKLERYLTGEELEALNKKEDFVTLGGDTITDKDLGLTSIKAKIDANEELTDAQSDLMKKYLNRIETATHVYYAFDRMGLTANSMAKRLGIDPKSVKNKIHSVTDLLQFMNDDGTINQQKLTNYIATTGNDVSYINDDTVQYAKTTFAKSQKGTIGGNVSGSIASTLSAIFGDPKIANKAGIAVGSAAGLGIAQILKDKGIISSPYAQYAIAAVGGGLMSLERTRKYMQTVFGPEGDIKNSMGVTNKQIFLAKVMQKYLPAIGASTLTWKYMNKALGVFGPSVQTLGLPLTFLMSAIAGAAAPSIMRGIQEKLFNTEKDDKSWTAKLGRHLRDIPFFKKYFDISGIKSSGELRMQTLTTIKRDLETKLNELKLVENPTAEQQAKIQDYESAIKEVTDLINDIEETVKHGTDEDATVSKETDEEIDKTLKFVNEVTADDNDYASLHTERYAKAKNANDIKANLNSNGTTMSDLNITDHYFADMDSLQAGMQNLGSYEYIPQTKWEKNGTVSELAKDYNEGEEFAYDVTDENKEFKRRFDLYRRARRINDFIVDKDEYDDESGFKHYLQSELHDYFTNDDEADDVMADIVKNEQDTMQDVLGPELAQRLMVIGDIRNKDKKAELFEQWKSELDADKIEALNDLTNDVAARDILMQKLFDITKTYVEVANYGKPSTDKLNPAQIEERALTMLSQVYNNNMLEDALGNKFKKQARKIGIKLATLIDPAADNEDVARHKELLSVYNSMNAGGKGDTATDTKHNIAGNIHINTRIQMSDLRGKKFKSGESLDIAGCSVVALNNTLNYMGVSTVGIDTLIGIADNHMTTDGGVNSDFFTEVADKLGLKATIYNNMDNKFTPEVISGLSPSRAKGIIVLVKNIDGNGYHYVTLRRVNKLYASIDDPELSNSDTRWTTSELSMRAQEIIVLEKASSKQVLIPKPIQAGLDTIKTIADKAKRVAKNIRQKGLLRTTAESVKETVSNYAQQKVIEPIRNKHIPFTNRTVGDVYDSIKDRVPFSQRSNDKPTRETDTTTINNNQPILDTDNLAQVLSESIISALSKSVINTRIIEDLTLPIKVNDEQAGRAIANVQASKISSNDKVAQEHIQATKRVIANSDVRNEMTEEDKSQEAIIRLGELAGDGMIAGSSTGKGGKGSGAAAMNASTATAESPTQEDEGDKPSILEAILGWKGVKKLSKYRGKITEWLGIKGSSKLAAAKTLAGATALAGATYLGAKHITAPALAKSYDQGRRMVANMPVVGHEEQRYEFDEENKMTTKGFHRDFAGGLRNGRDAVNLAKLGLKGATLGVNAVKTMANYTGSANKVVSTAAKVSTNIVNNQSAISKIIFNVAGLLDKIVATLNKFGIGNLGFRVAKDVAEPIKKFIAKIAPKLMTAGVKKGAGSILKKLPLLGTVLATGQMAISAVDAYRHPEAYTHVPPEKLSWHQKIRIAIAKSMFDAGMEWLFTAFGGGASIALCIGWSVIRSTNIVTLDDFLSILGVGHDQLLKSMSEEEKATEEVVDKAIKKGDEKAENDSKSNQSLAKSEPQKRMELPTSDIKDNVPQTKNLVLDPSAVATSDSQGNFDTPADQQQQMMDDIAKRQNLTHLDNGQFSSTDKGSVAGFDYNGAVDMKDKSILADESYVDMSTSQSAAGQKAASQFADKFNAELTDEQRKEILKNINSNPEYQLWNQKGDGWVHPLKNKSAVITSAFGPRSVTGGSKNHKGVDFRASTNTPIFAMKDGEVVVSTARYGEIKIKHDDGTMTRYLHLSQRFPKTGDVVKAGDRIGFAGGTGANGYPAYGTHLHLETYDKDSKIQDPLLTLGLNPSVLKLGPSGRENEAYLKRHEWLLAKSQEEANKLVKSEQMANKSSEKPEKLGLTVPKGGDDGTKSVASNPPVEHKSSSERKSVVNEVSNAATYIINSTNNTTKAIMKLSQQLDQVIQLLTKIGLSTSTISNNSMSDFNSPSIIR